MSTGEALLLGLSGLGAGLTGAAAGLCSLVDSYPALLADGLSPLRAT